jgi:uncharacterized membrane protein
LNKDPDQRLEEDEIPLTELLRIQNGKKALLTIITGLLGAVVFALIYVIPMPFIMVTLLKFSLIPALAIIAFIGAIRGPLAGFIAGYIGLVFHDLVFFNTVISFTLPAVGFGVLGLIVGFATYDLTNGRSLGKLALLSTIGLIFTALLLTVISLYVEQHSILVALGFTLLPLLTSGLPSVIFITPILARLWSIVSTKIELPLDFS